MGQVLPSNVARVHGAQDEILGPRRAELKRVQIEAQQVHMCAAQGAPHIPHHLGAGCTTDRTGDRIRSSCLCGWHRHGSVTPSVSLCVPQLSVRLCGVGGAKTQPSPSLSTTLTLTLLAVQVEQDLSNATRELERWKVKLAEVEAMVEQVKKQTAISQAPPPPFPATYLS